MCKPLGDSKVKIDDCELDLDDCVTGTVTVTVAATVAVTMKAKGPPKAARICLLATH